MDPDQTVPIRAARSESAMFVIGSVYFGGISLL